jgi:dUTP pyrophosphatase
MLPRWFKKNKILMIQVNIINKGNNELPAYATEGSAGLDIRANLTESITLMPLQRMLIPTGLYMEIPVSYEGQIRPRSGMAFKQGLTCLNSPGTIDSDYRGEIKVLLINLSNEPQQINHGDRIAQMIFAPVTKAGFVPQISLQETTRNEGGFGSTGVI